MKTLPEIYDESLNIKSPEDIVNNYHDLIKYSINDLVLYIDEYFTDEEKMNHANNLINNFTKLTTHAAIIKIQMLNNELFNKF